MDASSNLRFRAPYAPDDGALVEMLLREAALPAEAEAGVDALATDLIAAIRREDGHGAIETLLQEYALTTREGLALMSLAEALLRVPDAATADRLIADKLRRETSLTTRSAARPDWRRPPPGP